MKLKEILKHETDLSIDVQRTSVNAGKYPKVSPWREFGLQVSETQIPDDLKQQFDKPCPFTELPSSKTIKDTHICFYIPNYATTLNSAKSIGVNAKNIANQAKKEIPGIGIVWRYDPINDDTVVRGKWILMYVENNGIIPNSENKDWEESKEFLRQIDPAYRPMTTLETFVGAFGLLIDLGRLIYQERFSRVADITWTETLGESQLWVGRFNSSGLNNDGYIDIGGNLHKHPNRGLSACMEFLD